MCLASPVVASRCLTQEVADSKSFQKKLSPSSVKTFKGKNCFTLTFKFDTLINSAGTTQIEFVQIQRQQGLYLNNSHFLCR